MESSGQGRGAEFSLAAAVMFALVAIGFSAFILFWKAPQERPQQVKEALSEERKQAILKQVSESSQPVSPTSLSQPPESQADPNDTSAAMKLRILQSLKTAK